MNIQVIFFSFCVSQQQFREFIIRITTLGLYQRENLFLLKCFFGAFNLAVRNFRLFCYFLWFPVVIQGMHHKNNYPRISPQIKFIFTKKFFFGMLLSSKKFQIILLLTFCGFQQQFKECIIRITTLGFHPRKNLFLQKSIILLPKYLGQNFGLITAIAHFP